MKRFFLFINLAVVAGILLPNLFFVLAKPLEVKYPEFLDFKITETTTSLPQYIKYILFFFLITSGIIALGVIIYAGFRYLTSSGMPEKMRDARERIEYALLGLLILFLSGIILNTINPQLITLKISPINLYVEEIPPGVWLCSQKVDVPWLYRMTQAAQEDIKRYNEIPISSTTTRETMAESIKEGIERLSPLVNDMIKYCRAIDFSQEIKDANISSSWRMYFVPGKVETGAEPKYLIFGALIKDAAEKYEIVFRDPGKNAYRQSVPYESWPSIKPKFIYPFRVNYDPNVNWHVILYEKENYNADYINAKEYKCPGGFVASAFDDYRKSCNLPFPAESIKIEGEGDLIVILSKSPGQGLSFPDNRAILRASESNLLQEVFDEITDARPCWWWDIGWIALGPKCRYPAAKAVDILSITIY